MGNSVTVIMPVFNGELFLEEAIQSVLNQDYTDFELIILDDGSTDNSLKIIRSYSELDSRIRYITRENKGLCVSLNELLSAANFQLVFMMHADDVMYPNRLSRQSEFMDAHPDISICSSFVDYINDNGESIGKYTSPLTSMELVKKQAAQNEIIGFNHPSTVFRLDVIQNLGGYRQPFWPCEDIDLWNRAVEQDIGICVIPETLLRYRIHGSSASVARSKMLRMKHHYVKECMLMRRSGEAELTWDEFMPYWASRPLLQKMNVNRKDLAKAYYKKAVFAYAQKEYLSVFCSLVSAFLLQPLYVKRQVLSKYDKNA